MISLNDILRASNGQLFGEPSAHIFTDFCFDSREARESQIFVAMKTDRGDSHQYIDEAIRKGVSGVICKNPPDSDTEGVTVIVVKDPVDSLMQWARLMLSRLNAKVIVVAGSSARSTTAKAIACVLDESHNVYFRDVDVAGRLGIVIGLAEVKPSHNAVVLKLSTTYPGEMAEMADMVKPSIAVITHIDCYHSDSFESCDQLLQEFSVLIESLPKEGIVVINHDDSNVQKLSTQGKAKTKSVALESFGSDFMAYNVVIGANGTGFDLRYDGDRKVGRWTPLLSKYHLYSILYALAVGHHMNVDVDTGLNRLKSLEPLRGRMKSFTGLNGSLLVDDTYGASLLSMQAAIDWISAIKYSEQRTILMLGDMDNIGINNQQAHRAVGQAITKEIDYLITKGPNAALIGRATLDNGMNPNNVRMTYSIQDAISELNRLNLTELDVVLVKGGRQSDMELITRELMHNVDDHVNLIRQTQIAQVVNVLAQSMSPSHVEIDTEALAGNVRVIKEKLGSDIDMMAVVKANGYGHGAITVARTSLLNGASFLAVANMVEALELRDAGITAPILVLSYIPIIAVRQAIQQNISVSLFDLEIAQQYERVARDVEGKLKVHVKIDSGMGRLGALPADAIRLFRHLHAMQQLEIEGIFTHFSSADEDPNYTNEQLDTFRDVLAPIRAAGFQFKYVHAANSSGVLGKRDNFLTIARPGVILYGLRPSESLPFPEGIKPVMSWKTVVIQVKTLPPNSAVGYGNTYRTKGHETIAVLPIGYADGLRRSPQTWREVLIHGKRAPIIGRISMEKTTINVTSIADVSVGDEVVLLGGQGDEMITAEEVARWLGTINYEVVTTILPRIPRQ